MMYIRTMGNHCLIEPYLATAVFQYNIHVVIVFEITVERYDVFVFEILVKLDFPENLKTIKIKKMR